MQYFLAAFPILLVLGVMILFRWGGQRAGPVGWIAGLLAAWIFFGLNWQVLWVSQLKGLFLSLFVLVILWPALLLYHVTDLAGGVSAIAYVLQRWIGEGGLLLVLLAWAFSGLLEGLAGFGLPIAIVAPMLVALGVPAVQAVAAVAVGHAWSVTFGDMSVVFQTLAAIVDLPQEQLAPMAGLFLGIACILCGVAAAVILGQRRHILKVILLGMLMACVQYGLAITRLVPLSVMAAGLSGVFGGIFLGRLSHRKGQKRMLDKMHNGFQFKPLLAGLGIYGLLTLLLAILFLNQHLYDQLRGLVWQMQFPATITSDGFAVAAAGGQAMRPLVHPGLYILFVSLLGGFILRRTGMHQAGDWQRAMQRTWRSAGPVSVGILSMVSLSMLMDHSGMTFLLARGLSEGLNLFFPLVSPLVGVLGAFATGSNNNSNVLFAPLQNRVAMLLHIDARLLLAAQTTGGALGSMIAPAKIIVGCSTVGLKNKDGDVLRVTIPYCIGICLVLGALAWVLT